MARYIDADKLINKMFPIGLVDNGKYTINAKAVKVAIDQTPTADVVPKRDTYYIEEGKPPVLIETSENRRSKIAREIFEEIEKAHDECIGVDITTRIGYFHSRIPFVCRECEAYLAPVLGKFECVRKEVVPHQG